jgi:hypothetical protein
LSTELKQATDAIKSARDVVELLVVLLKICRRHASEVVVAGQDRETRRWMVQEAARTEAAAAVFQSRVLTPADRDAVIKDLERATDLAVTARAWALGIDTAMRTQAQVYSQLCAKPPNEIRILKEYDPYPTLSVELKSMYGDRGGFSRKPRRSTATAFDRVDGLALWPSASSQPLTVTYDTVAGAHLDNALRERATVNILAVVPNKDFWDEFDIDERSDDRFFGVHPKHEATQESRIIDALQLARDRNVDIVVTPELCCTPNTVGLIKARLAAMGRGRPGVVIAGGSHIEPNIGERRNRMTTIYAANPAELTHDKIGEFIFAAGGKKREEDIDRSTELRIHAGNSWSMITLICADLLDDAVVDALADLCPRLVIVPSMSSKTGDYEMSMGAVIRKSQALVMVVNGPPEWRPTPEDRSHIVRAPIVVIGMPLASSWIARTCADPSDAAPYKVLFCSDQRQADFI